MTFKTCAVIGIIAATLGLAADAAAQPPRELYNRALARDRTVRNAGKRPTLVQIRQAVAAYERVVRAYPTSGYADNALMQGAELSRLAFERFGQASDRRTAVRLLALLKTGYPHSPLTREASETLAGLDAPTKPAAASSRPPTSSTTTREIATAPAAETSEAETERARAAEDKADAPVAAAPSARRPSASSAPATIRNITRTPMPDGVRVSIEVDREVLFYQERLQNPQRVFFDLRGGYPAPGLIDKTFTYTDEEVVRMIRLGRHPQNTTRVVMDTEGVDSYSVFTLYEPYRLIIDFKRSANAASRAATPPPMVVPTTGVSVAADTKSSAPAPPRAETTENPPPTPSTAPAPAPPTPVSSAPLASRAVTSATLPPPAVPSANSNGQFSLARQLGLGISRIVIDPGHGGHDPGVSGSGMQESELVLDVSLRLRKLLQERKNIEVVMTRDSNVYIPLEQRTAIANRESADLFLSIHANASRNVKARGIETYFLNFASNPEAEAVAARENSASGQTMHSLPSIVRAIALNNKIDESRDFADMVQKSMVRKLSPRTPDLRDRGVKQAPFVVLIGAGMPSVLAEISFMSHKQEGALLKTAAYRQEIAEALLDAVVRYQQSLKSRTTIAARDN